MSGIYRGPNGSATADALNIDGDKGDLSISNSGLAWTINPDVVTTTKLGGDITSAGKALLDDADASAQRTTLGLGDASTANIGSDVLAYDSNLQSFVDTFTLPTTDATNGFVLTTDGAGTLSLTAPGGIADDDYGDITVSTGATVWTVNNDAITYAKIQNVSATDKLLGRSSAGAGNIEEITCTTAGRNLLDDVDASAQRTTLGLGALATQGDGDKGDIVVSGSGATWTIDTDAVTFSKLQNITTSRLLGRTTAGSGDIEELTTGDRLSLSAGVLNATAYPLTNGVSVSASGTAIDFTGIPSWAKRITIILSGISTNGSSNPLIQIGDSGGIENTGYAASSVAPVTGAATVGANYTTGFGIASNNAAAIVSGLMSLVNITGNEWVSSHSTGFSATNASSLGGGNKTLSTTLDRVRITTVNGTDSYDAGTINILWE